MLQVVNMRGMFRAKVFRQGQLIESIEDKNLIVTTGRTNLARLLGAGNAGDYQPITHIKFGTGSTAAAPADVDIEAPVLTKAIDSVSYPAAGQVEFDWSLTTAEANGIALREFGLFNRDDPATTYYLFSRIVRATAFNKEADIEVSGSWTIEF